jgi:phosphoglycolate phosphatase
MFMADTKSRVVRALIFDLDGTLIDSKLDLIHSVNAMLAEMKRPQLAAETISGYIGHGAPQLVARALGGTATEEELNHALKFFLGYYEEHKMDNTCAYPGVPETLAQLTQLPMAVLTNKPVRISVRILNSLGLANYFRVIYGGNSFESKKPDPFGANKILQELGVAAREALLIGDSEVDIQTARNAGTQAAAVNYGFGVHDRTAHPADIYLERFADLADLVRNHTAV